MNTLEVQCTSTTHFSGTNKPKQHSKDDGLQSSLSLLFLLIGHIAVLPLASSQSSRISSNILITEKEVQSPQFTVLYERHTFADCYGRNYMTINDTLLILVNDHPKIKPTMAFQYLS